MVMRSKLVAVCAAAAAVVATGCGKEEASVVGRAVQQDIKSAQLRITADFKGSQPGSFEITGPYRSNGPGKLASFDWTVNADIAGGRPVDAEVISSGRNLFVEYRGRTYEVGERRVARYLRREARSQGEKVDGLGDLERLGIDLDKWFPESSGPQDATLNGEPTTRVTGRLDASAALQDVAALIRRPELRRQLGPQARRLTPRQVKLLANVFEDPRMEIQVGREDGKFRRIAATTKIAGNLLRIAAEWTRVDQPVTIEAPAKGLPIKRLLRRLNAGSSGHATARAPS